jgi:hypothetical protein
VAVIGGLTGGNNTVGGATPASRNIPTPCGTFPIIPSATTPSGSTVIEGRLNTDPGHTFAIQFFSNPDDDEGKTFLGQRRMTTNEKGNVSSSFSPKRPVRAGATITATATGPDCSTSEFSAPRAVLVS